MKHFTLSLLALAFGLTSALAQKKGRPAPAETRPAATLAQARLQGYQQRQNLAQNSVVANLKFRNVGPTVMSGRVVDLAVCPTDPSHFVAAYATGGLWHTTNNGTAFAPLFEQQASYTLGAVAVRWQGTTPAAIWLGTGESNSSRSSYAGTGLYKSLDGGRTWLALGLPETHHIGRIVLHPTDANVAWVAAVGHLYSPNPERGVYLTTDGGQTWRKTLYLNEKTGAIDLVIDPQNPQVLYAALWERHREAWDFAGSGLGSGIYKSTDGGATWAKLNTPESGFPATAGTGRIGLAVFPGNPNLIFATLDNQDNREAPAKTETAETTPAPSVFRKMTAQDLEKMPDEQLQAYFTRYGIPAKYTPKSVKAEVAQGKYPAAALADFVNANDDLFNIEVKGAELYRSEDGGKTWRKTHEGYIDDLVYTYGYYFGQVRVAPQDPQRLYLLGVPAIKSTDGGKTWAALNSDNAHSDHHALWLNPQRPGHLLLGNDGGLNLSYDDGASWFKLNNLAVGQFYSVQLDMATPYQIYGGLQDNGVWAGPSTYRQTTDWHDTGQYPYKMLMGGDGMQVEIDTRDNNTLYTGFQFGNYFRINKATGTPKPITPRHSLGETPYRWNWETPIHLSRHNQDVLYMGSHRFHRSLDRGDNFQTLSADLTRGGKKGNVPYGSLTTLEESPRRFGLLYTGSDDGLVHVSKDGGYTWAKIYDSPQQFWVTQVEPSHHAEGRVFLSLNGYRFDHFAPLLYTSDDYGQTWRALGQNLPLEPINVVKEDPANENILYVGTDHGAYVSLDRGVTFMAFAGLPAVPVHDLAIHPRDKDLVLATHGRSFYVANVAHLQQLTPTVIDKSLHVFAPAPVSASPGWGRKRGFAAPVEPSHPLPFYVNHTNKTYVTQVQIRSAGGLGLRTLTDSSEVGLNYLAYNLAIDETAVPALEKELTDKAKKPVKITKADNGQYYLPAGEYTLEVTLSGQTEKQPLKVETPSGGGRRFGPTAKPERD
jgi:photosystem II stability/assembly factor-like uncharacterized protein